MSNLFTIDVEDWFHILDDPAVPNVKYWSSLDSQIENNVDKLLELLHNHGTRATFFWLGWLAKRHKAVLRRCCDAGHEIASHGYNHMLPMKVGPESFKHDIEQAKKTLEDIIGKQVRGFRVAGFGIKKKINWPFNTIKEAGYEYDSSIFPAMYNYKMKCGIYIISTEAGPLFEIPLSASSLCGIRLFFFGGGYLRLSPIRLMQWGIKKLQKTGCPLVVYIHPREIDPDHTRLLLSPFKRFRCYVNLKSTIPKLQWLCKNYSFVTMSELVDEFLAR